MKIGVISDSHISSGSIHPKKLASRFINKVKGSAAELCEMVRPHFKDVELIIHAGDFVSYDVITAFEEFAPLEGVAGNMDPYEISSRLPIKTVVKAAGKRIGVVHGHGPATGLERKLRREFDDVDCIVFGHTHRPFSEAVDRILMFNPGSPTDQRWAPSRSIGIIYVEKSIRTELISLP